MIIFFATVLVNYGDFNLIVVSLTTPYTLSNVSWVDYEKSFIDYPLRIDHSYTVSENLVLSAVRRIFQSFSQFPTLKGKELIL